MKYPKVKDVQIKVGSLLRVEDDLYIYCNARKRPWPKYLLGIVLEVNESPLQHGDKIKYDYTTVRWDNGNTTLYLYGNEEVLSL